MPPYPKSPWQRGPNENTSRLHRQQCLKGIDLSRYTQARLNNVAWQLNERPRKTLECNRVRPALMLKHENGTPISKSMSFHETRNLSPNLIRAVLVFCHGRKVID